MWFAEGDVRALCAEWAGPRHTAGRAHLHSGKVCVGISQCELTDVRAVKKSRCRRAGMEQAKSECVSLPTCASLMNQCCSSLTRTMRGSRVCPWPSSATGETVRRSSIVLTRRTLSAAAASSMAALASI